MKKRQEKLDSSNLMSENRSLTQLEKEIIHQLQKDLPVVKQPFAAVAEKLGITEFEVIEKVREFVADGTIRRFGATLRHQRSGFEANAMVVWEVELDRVEEVGKVFASFREVSHCYQRPVLSEWPYRLFTMIHSTSEEECRQIAKRMAEAAGMQVTPHCPKADPNTAYMLHFAAVVPNLGPHQEYRALGPGGGWWAAPSFEARDGVVRVPAGPGLGVEYYPAIWREAQRL